MSSSSDEDTEESSCYGRDNKNVHRARSRGQHLTKKSPVKDLSGKTGNESLSQVSNESIAQKLVTGWGQGQHDMPTLYDESDVWGQGLRSNKPPKDLRKRGQSVPIGFAKFVAPDINTDDFMFYDIPGGRVAVMKWTTPGELENIMKMIQAKGPASIHYVRVHDTVMPNWLSPQNKQLISEVVSNTKNKKLQYALSN